MLSDCVDRYAAVATVSKEQHVARASMSNATPPVDAFTPADGLLQVSQHTEVASMCLSAPEVRVCIRTRLDIAKIVHSHHCAFVLSGARGDLQRRLGRY